MHQLLPLKWKLSLIIGLAAAIGFVAQALNLPHLAIGAVIGIVEIVVIFLASKTWRYTALIPFLPLWTRVDLSGEWEGVIESQWQGRQKAPTLDPIPCLLTIHQNWDDIVFCLKTDKMTSRSSGVLPKYDRSTKQMRFQYFFQTEPFAKSAAHNPPQLLGCAAARVNLANPAEILVRYTNERGNGGDITLSRLKRTRRTNRRAVFKELSVLEIRSMVCDDSFRTKP
jgi:hypothetical protein